MLRLSALAALLASPLLAGAAESLTLSQAIDRALADSPDARIAAARLDGSQAALAQARAVFQPQVSVQSGYLRTNQPVSVFGLVLNQRRFSSGLDFNDVPDADNWASGATLTYPLYAGGRHSAARDAALAALNASRHGAEAVRQVLAFEVTRTFLLIHRTRSLIAAAEAAVTAFESNLRLSQKRLEAGAALKTDALDLEVRLAEAREDLARAKNAGTLTRQSLAMLLGLEQGEVDAATELPPLQTPAATAAASRPEVLAAESVAQAAAARIRQAASGWKPSLNAFGSAEHHRGGKFDGQGSNYTVGVMAQWNLWDGGLTRGRVNEAEAEWQAAEEAVRRQRLAVRLEVQQARAALREAEERQAVSAKSVQLAEESVQLTRDRFETGLALAAQLIDAETALTAARVRRAEAETDRRLAIAALRRALGMTMIAHPSK